jgi:two-component system chemotaxis sensor kinase CheA
MSTRAETTNEADEEMAELVREFVLESQEMLDRMDHDLLALEERPEDLEAVDHIFRAMHTLKGTCGFLGFGLLESATHAGEHLLSRLRDGALRPTPDIGAALMALGDVVRTLLRNIETTGGEGHVELGALRSWLANLAAGDGQAPAPPPQAPPPQAPPPPAPPRRAPEPEPEPAGNEDATRPRGADESIRVDVGHLERLMNLVGELVLARNQILQQPDVQRDQALGAICGRLSNLTTELQEAVMKTRMQPVGTVWNKIPRMVRDLARACGKQARLEMDGGETELDRTLVEAIKDPLTHVIRNCVDHGIEAPAARSAAGKPVEGTLSLRAFHEAGQVIVEIADDGAGIDVGRVREKAIRRGLVTPAQAERMSDRELCQLIFLPGFSTREEVTHVSGRGVGMDVVRTNIERIGGTVDLHNRPGLGMTLRMRLPLTLAIIPVLIVRSGGQRFAVPQASLLELVAVEASRVERLYDAPVLRLRGELLPLVDLCGVLRLEPAPADPETAHIVIVQFDGRTFGLLVDAIDDTQEIVVKPLNSLLKSLACYSGATILGDGEVALILDVPGLAVRARLEHPDVASTDSASAAAADEAPPVSLLVMETFERARVAVPLEFVSRLEEAPRSAMERAAGRPAMQYRDRVLPLIEVGRALALTGGSTPETDAPMTVVVVTLGGRSAGLVVENIVDIVTQSLDVQAAAAVPGTLGSAVVQGRITDLLDVPRLLGGWATPTAEA